MKFLHTKLLIASLLLSSSTAFASIYNFTRVTNTNVEDLGSQLSVDITEEVTSLGSNVLFTFKNNVGTPSNVAEIYFDNEATNFFSDYGIQAQNVEYQDVVINPNDPPGVSGFTANYAVDNGRNGDALNQASEFITIFGLLSGTNTYSQVIAAIDGGAYNIALHVRSIGIAGESDSYVIGGAPGTVPVPAAGWLLGSALLGFVGLRRRKH